MGRGCQRRLGRGNADGTHCCTAHARARVRPGVAGNGRVGAGRAAGRQCRIAGQGAQGQPGTGRRHRPLPRRAFRRDRGGGFEARLRPARRPPGP
ncbi:hypothetical protein G6F24_018250 [Rhizopus arrhizus]|nr:hypothetical protein G6F24_018250 [Rhizopus arrhizus]